VLLGGPVFGFIVLQRGVVWLSFLTSLLALLTLSYYRPVAHCPYAPLMKPPTDITSQLFWTGSGWLFAFPHIAIIVLVADQTLNWWRQREDTIRIMSRTDALTGIHNRRSIIELLEKETARTHRHGPPLCTVLIDLDHFKHINDRWGHPTGDRVLTATAAVLRNTIRQCDAVGRYGGEEFMLVLPDTDLVGAEALVERCRVHLAEMNITSDSGEPIPVSGSFGLICNQLHLAASVSMLVKEADDALYRAKTAGRNRVISYNLTAPVRTD
jgi:diguanylate cyclase (GGDEF)-like protein